MGSRYWWCPACGDMMASDPAEYVPCRCDAPPKTPPPASQSVIVRAPNPFLKTKPILPPKRKPQPPRAAAEEG